jgi:hypothetical protein
VSKPPLEPIRDPEATEPARGIKVGSGASKFTIKVTELRQEAIGIDAIAPGVGAIRPVLATLASVEHPRISAGQPLVQTTHSLV